MSKFWFILLALLIGCATVPVVKKVLKPKVPIVKMVGARGWGCGAPIGALNVITVEHVAAITSYVSVDDRYYKVRPYAVVQHGDMPEGIVFYHTMGHAFKKWYEIGTGKPHLVRTSRGDFPAEGYIPVPGDSGSPVLNKEGQLVALVSGLMETTRIAVEIEHIPVFVKVTPLK